MEQQVFLDVAIIANSIFGKKYVLVAFNKKNKSDQIKETKVIMKHHNIHV